MIHIWCFSTDLFLESTQDLMSVNSISVIIYFLVNLRIVLNFFLVTMYSIFKKLEARLFPVFFFQPAVSANLCQLIFVQTFANAMRRLRRSGKIGEFVSIYVHEKQVALSPSHPPRFGYLSCSFGVLDWKMNLKLTSYIFLHLNIFRTVCMWQQMEVVFAGLLLLLIKASRGSQNIT